MATNNKQIILTSLLCNPSVPPLAKERIFLLCDDSWDWISALPDSHTPKQCVPLVSQLIQDKLASVIESQGSKIDLPINLSNAIVQFIEQPDVLFDTARPILEKFEQHNFHWSCYKYIVNAVMIKKDGRDEFLHFLIASQNQDFVKETASNPNTPPEFLELISKSTAFDVKEQLARNHATGSALLQTLATNYWDQLIRPLSPDVRIDVASNICM